MTLKKTMTPCCSPADDLNSCCSAPAEKLVPLQPMQPGPQETSCCASAPEPTCCGGSPVAEHPGLPRIPGYALQPFVARFLETPAGPVPVVKTELDISDRLGTLRVRAGIGRDSYSIAPGLYAVGAPAPGSPVIVTANYKLTFDTLRQDLSGLDAWLLVVDTRGINVWCAAGKGTFSTSEVIAKVRAVELDKVAAHKTLILPQLAAPGVSAREVKKGCGFKVVFGPVRAGDLKAFIRAGNTAEPAMRTATFPLGERLVLIPVELSGLRKISLWVVLAAFILAGIGPSVFSFGAAWSRGLAVIAGYAAGVFAGAGLVPALLPLIPGRAFALKGIVTGAAAGGLTLIGMGTSLSTMECAAMLLWIMGVSSFTGMNFTGATPFTSPSGVEKEMRIYMPVQGAALLLAAGLWITAAFTA